MRIVLHILIFIVATAVSAQAATLDLNPGYKPERWDGRDPIIDPDFGLYGVPFGSSKAEVMAALGDPRGIFIINESQTGLLYGVSHMLIFRLDRLVELAVDPFVVDWEVSRSFDTHPIFDKKWILKPGIARGTSFGDVLKAFGRSPATPDYRYEFDGERSTIQLRFDAVRAAHETRDSEPEYQLRGVTIKFYDD